MAIDYVRIWVKAGDGGKGCPSKYKNKYMRYPRFDGGCGGKGGDVVIQADSSINTLRHLHFRQHFKADNGRHGSSNKKHGANAEDLIIRVPVGTLVKDALTGKLLKDLSNPGMKVVVARGGKGGIGSAYTRDHSVVPPGEGEERQLILELKVLADIGIVGLPSSGKSTLLNTLTGAGSVVGAYPFTTKNPVLGMLSDLDVVIADMPGIIEGAHKGRGLGDKFLRHIERARILVYVIDASPMAEMAPWDAYVILLEELRRYNPSILEKSQIVVLNKIDLLEDCSVVDEFIARTNQRPLLISARTGEGVEKLVDEIRNRLEKQE